MAKPKRRYVCQACGSLAQRWQGWLELEAGIAAGFGTRPTVHG